MKNQVETKGQINAITEAYLMSLGTKNNVDIIVKDTGEVVNTFRSGIRVWSCDYDYAEDDIFIIVS